MGSRLSTISPRSAICLPSENMVFSWKELDNKGLESKKGGDSLSRRLDQSKNLEDFVRLSFTAKHPMMFVCKRDGRLKNPVVLKIDIAACSLHGTLFSDRNATASSVLIGPSPSLVHFETVKKEDHFRVDTSERPYYQAEILIRTWLPPKFISFPEKSQAFVKHNQPSSQAQLRTQALDFLALCTPSPRTRSLKPSKLQLEMSQHQTAISRKKIRRKVRRKVPSDDSFASSYDLFAIEEHPSKFVVVDNPSIEVDFDDELLIQQSISDEHDEQNSFDDMLNRIPREFL